MTEKIDINDLTADQLTIQGLITSLIDYQEQLRGFLLPCLERNATHNSLMRLVSTVNFQQDIIASLLDCVQRLNDSDIKALNELNHQLIKGGDHSCN